MIKCEVSSVSLTFIGEDALSSATRSLALLKKIEVTIATLCYDQSVFGNIAKFARNGEQALLQAPRKAPIDLDGVVEESLLRAQESMFKLHKTLVKRRESAQNDYRLTEEDGVAEEFTRTINVVKETHDAINDLRCAINEHDADLEESSGLAISDPNELRKYLSAI